MNIVLDEGAFMPTRAHENDAGLDLYARDTQIVPAKESATFDTGVHIELRPWELTDSRGAVIARFKTVGYIKSKSGLNAKGITSDGTIDMGYTGSIKVVLRNHSGRDYTVNQGDKITQLVIQPIFLPELNVVDSLEETERGNNGFGSTGV